jgi:quercetin dioxygenase-like cupin family protein
MIPLHGSYEPTQSKTQETNMSLFNLTQGRLRSVAIAAIATATFSVAAQAGECPADKVKPNAREAVNFKPVGVTDTTLGAIDLGKEKAKLKGRELRIRKMVIEPGGIVPWHSHDDRPALIYVVEGEILEFASNCAGPILNKAGDVRAEKQGTAHWWKNLSDKPAVLFIGDVRADPNDKHM